MAKRLTAPFPYFGGKSGWAQQVWQRLGTPDIYSEPFAGSLALLLACPTPARLEVVCDTDGLICNFWRAVSRDPEAVAKWADWPTIHHDLLARHKWLQAWVVSKSGLVSDDADYFDAKAAGWWVWGVSNWFGSGWCAPGNKSTQVPYMHTRDFGAQGIAKRRVNKPHDTVLDWMSALCKRLENAVILNRDWRTGVSPATLKHKAADSVIRAIVLDPPYQGTAGARRMYKSDTDGSPADPAQEAYDWAVAHGEQYRIVYFCEAQDYPVPQGWAMETKGLKGRRTDKRGATDCAIFSPACIHA